jgi:hypothetical protein
LFSSVPVGREHRRARRARAHTARTAAVTRSGRKTADRSMALTPRRARQNGQSSISHCTTVPKRAKKQRTNAFLRPLGRAEAKPRRARPARTPAAARPATPRRRPPPPPSPPLLAQGTATGRAAAAMTVDAALEKDGPQDSSLPLMVTNPADTSSVISASSHRITSVTPASSSAAGLAAASRARRHLPARQYPSLPRRRPPAGKPPPPPALERGRARKERAFRLPTPLPEAGGFT